MFVKTDNANRIIQYPYTLDMFRAENRNVSLPKYLNNRFLANRHVFPVVNAPEPAYDEVTQYLVAATEPTFETDKWVLGWTVADKTQAQIDADTEAKANQVRTERDRLLAETDWVTIRATDTGTPVEDTWATYRQSLRDITTQLEFPYNVVWPTKPE